MAFGYIVDGVPVALPGIKVYPKVLFEVDLISDPNQDAMVDVLTVRSPTPGWKEQLPVTGYFPYRWIRQFVLPNNLAPFLIHPSFTHHIIPLAENGSLEKTPTSVIPEWGWYERIYQQRQLYEEKRTLQVAMSKEGVTDRQLACRESKLVMNIRKQGIKAAILTDPDLIVGGGLYWLSGHTDELRYLAMLLNCPLVTDWTHTTEATSEEFHLWFWGAIPQYNSNLPAHQGLVNLYEAAQDTASTVNTSKQTSLELFRQIHEYLREEIEPRWSNWVRQVLPDVDEA